MLAQLDPLIKPLTLALWRTAMVGSKLLKTLSLLAGLSALNCVDGASDPGPRNDRVKITASERLHGFAVFGHEVRSFRPCYSEDTLWVNDQTALLWDLYRELAPRVQPYEEVFFVLNATRCPPPEEGFGKDYSGGLLVEKILYAAREGLSCETDWTSFDYLANGNEPSWSAVVSERGLELRRLGQPELTWPHLSQKASGKGITFEGRELALTPVILQILPASCRDSMSGAFYGYESKLLLGPEEFRGCALQGERRIE